MALNQQQRDTSASSRKKALNQESEREGARERETEREREGERRTETREREGYRDL